MDKYLDNRVSCLFFIFFFHKNIIRTSLITSGTSVLGNMGDSMRQPDLVFASFFSLPIFKVLLFFCSFILLFFLISYSQRIVDE